MAIHFNTTSKQLTSFQYEQVFGFLKFLIGGKSGFRLANVAANMDEKQNLPSSPELWANELVSGKIRSVFFWDGGYKNQAFLSTRDNYLAFSMSMPQSNLHSNADALSNAKRIFEEVRLLGKDNLNIGKVTNGILDQSTSIREDIPFYFIPNITLNWKTVLSPDYYSEYWDREILLKAPAYEVTERENGWIEIQTYRDLFGPLSEESLGQIRKLACYLEKYNKKAKYSMAKRPQMYINEKESRPGCFSEPNSSI